MSCQAEKGDVFVMLKLGEIQTIVSGPESSNVKDINKLANENFKKLIKYAKQRSNGSLAS